MALEDYLNKDMDYVKANEMHTLTLEGVAQMAEQQTLQKKALAGVMAKYAKDPRYQDKLVRLAKRNERLINYRTEYSVSEFASLPADVNTANNKLVKTVKDHRHQLQLRDTTQRNVTRYKNFNIALCQLETLLADKPPAPELKSAVEGLIAYIKAQKAAQQQSTKTLPVANAVVVIAEPAVVQGEVANVEAVKAESVPVAKVSPDTATQLKATASIEALTLALNETYRLLGGKPAVVAGYSSGSYGIFEYKNGIDFMIPGGQHPDYCEIPLVLGMAAGIYGLEFFLIGITPPIVPGFVIAGSILLAVSLVMLATAAVIAMQPRTGLAKEMFAVADVARKVENENRLQKRYDASLAIFKRHKASFADNSAMTTPLTQFEHQLEEMAKSGVEKREECVIVLSDVNTMLAKKTAQAAQVVLQQYNTTPPSLTLFTPKPLDAATQQLYNDVQTLAVQVKTLNVDAMTQKVEETIQQFAMA